MAPLWSFCELLTGYSLLLYSSKIEPISQQAGEKHTDEEKDFLAVGFVCFYKKLPRQVQELVPPGPFCDIPTLSRTRGDDEPGSASLAASLAVAVLFWLCWALSPRSGLQSWIILTSNVTKISWGPVNTSLIWQRCHTGPKWVYIDGGCQGSYKENWDTSHCSCSPSAPPPQKVFFVNAGIFLHVLQKTWCVLMHH